MEGKLPKTSRSYYNKLTGIYNTFRSIHQRCSIKIGALKNFAKFTGKHLCQTPFFNKVAGGACNFNKKKTLAQVFYRTPLVAASVFHFVFSKKMLHITIVTSVGAVLIIVGIIVFMCCRKKIGEICISYLDLSVRLRRFPKYWKPVWVTFPSFTLRWIFLENNG